MKKLLKALTILMLGGVAHAAGGTHILQGDAITAASLTCTGSPCGTASGGPTLIATQTWSGSNNWTSPSVSTFTYGVLASTLTLSSISQKGGSLTLNNSGNNNNQISFNTDAGTFMGQINLLTGTYFRIDDETLGPLVMQTAGTENWRWNYKGDFVATSSGVFNGNVNLSSGVLLSGTAGTNGQVLTSGGSGAVPTWTTVSGGGGSGAQLSSQLLDCQVTYQSATVLLIASTATITNPCKVKIDDTIYQITSSATVTIGAVTGVARIYVSSLGVVTAGNSGSSGMTCNAGCTIATSVSAFPAGSVPLVQWNATVSGSWDATGTDLRTIYSATTGNTAGTGILVSGKLISVDTTMIPRKFYGAGAPGSVSGSRTGDSYVNTTSSSTYFCNNPSSDCSGVSAGNWIAVGGTSVITEELLTVPYNCAAGGGVYPGQYWSYPNAGYPSGGCASDFGYAVWSNASSSTGTFRVHLPANWDGTAPSLSFTWYQGDGGGGANVSRFKFATVCRSSGTSNASSYNADQIVDSVSPAATATLTTGILSSMTTTGCSAGQDMFVRVWRDNSVGSNYAGNANMINTVFTYKHN